MSKTKKISLMILAGVGAAFALDPSLALAAMNEKELAEYQIVHGSDSAKAIAAALAISIAAFGGALGQGKAATAALEGIARNPSASGRIFTPMILGLALIESLVIYALLIAFKIAP